MAHQGNVDDSNEIMFFLGAGASIAAGIVDIVKLVDELVNWIVSNNQQLSKLSNEVIKIIHQWESNNSREGYLNIETLLETVERLETNFRDVLPDFFKDRSLKFDEHDIKLIKQKSLSEEIKKFIQISFQNIKNINYYNALNDFISNYRPLYVFTTNYDLVLEQFCYKNRKKYSDLFKGSEWSPKISDPSEFDVILHKLHGSINWYRTERGKYIKLLEKTTKTKIELFNNERAVPLILYPGKKLEYIEPTLEMLNMLKESLSQVNCCFVIGYSFKDDHLLKLFLYSSNKNQDMVLFLVTPNAHTIYNERLKRHSDDEFPHSYSHEIFNEDDFNVTVPSDLEGKVICLPYKIQIIFPKLLDYYESLRKATHLEQTLKSHRGKIDPLSAFMTTEDSSFNLLDYLKSLSDCEYFEKIEEIVVSRTDGWDSIINEMAKVQRSSEDIMYVLDIFLKSYFNYWHSDRKAKYITRLLKYLAIRKSGIKVRIKNYMINLSFQLVGAELSGYLGYKYFEYLETKYLEYQKISEIQEEDILMIIRKEKIFFTKWQNGEIELRYYIENFVTNNADNQNLINLKEKLQRSRTRGETNSIEIEIINTISKIENLL
jgi:hypothetical protein